MKDGGPANILLDSADAHLLVEHNWLIGANGYIYKSGARRRGEQCLLHRIVMGAKPGEEIHHRNGNKRDCRKGNLAMVTASSHQDHHKHVLVARNRAGRVYPTKRTCQQCGRTFTVDPQHRGRNRFCSKSCGAKASAPERMKKRKENYGY